LNQIAELGANLVRLWRESGLGSGASFAARDLPAADNAL
jgi:hypothetical protein